MASKEGETWWLDRLEAGCHQGSIVPACSSRQKSLCHKRYNQPKPALVHVLQAVSMTRQSWSPGMIISKRDRKDNCGVVSVQTESLGEGEVRTGFVQQVKYTIVRNDHLRGIKKQNFRGVETPTGAGKMPFFSLQTKYTSQVDSLLMSLCFSSSSFYTIHLLAKGFFKKSSQKKSRCICVEDDGWLLVFMNLYLEMVVEDCHQAWKKRRVQENKASGNIG